MSEKVTAMIEEIKGLTVLELSELVHALVNPAEDGKHLLIALPSLCLSA